jgi:hypothetical protein
MDFIVDIGNPSKMEVEKNTNQSWSPGINFLSYIVCPSSSNETCLLFHPWTYAHYFLSV